MELCFTWAAVVRCPRLLPKSPCRKVPPLPNAVRTKCILRRRLIRSVLVARGMLSKAQLRGRREHLVGRLNLARHRQCRRRQGRPARTLCDRSEGLRGRLVRASVGPEGASECLI